MLKELLSHFILGKKSFNLYTAIQIMAPHRNGGTIDMQTSVPKKPTQHICTSIKHLDLLFRPFIDRFYKSRKTVRKNKKSKMQEFEEKSVPHENI